MSATFRIVPEENVEDSIFAMIGRLAESYKAVRVNRGSFSELHENVMQLEKFIGSLDQGQEHASSILEDITPETMSGLNEAYRFWEAQLDEHFAHRVVAGEACLSDYPLYDRVGDLVRRELAMFSGAQPQRILLIGSGSFPISAIHVHLQTGLPVHCVGRDSGMVAIAQQALERCNLSSTVQVFCNSDGSYNVSDYDLILIELLASPKKSILRNLRKHCRRGCQILCRTSCGLRKLLHEPIPGSDVRGFHVKGQQVAEGGQTISTLLLEPARSAAADIRMQWLEGVDSDTAAQLLRLINRTLEEETTIGFPGPIDDETGYALMGKLDAAVKSGNCHVLVASKDGVIVGQLILTPNSSPNHRHMVELTRGTIHPSFRGGGLALIAFQEVARKCKELRRELICLDVRAGTQAAMWWQYFGFKPFGLLPDYSRVGEKKYQGLYLYQATADLEQRIKEITTDPRDVLRRSDLQRHD
jgi:hypothetical protein